MATAAHARSSLELLNNVPPEKLDEPCKDEHLIKLALSITDWRSIAPFLGLTEADESEIEDCKKVRTKKIKMLRKWRNKLGEKGTYGKLAEVLLELEETDLVEMLCGLIWQPHSSSSDIQSQDSHKLHSTSEVQRDPEDTSRSIRCHYAKTLKDKYHSGVPTFLTLQWPPPPTHKVFNLAMISQKVLQYGPDEELVRLLQKGDVSSAVSSRNTVTLEQISDNLHSKGRKIILIEGAPGAGKSTLAWHLCNRWEAGELFQEFEIVLFVQLREPAVQFARCFEDLLPTDTDMRSEVVSAIQYCGGHQILIVLDSWDEFKPGLNQGSVIKNLICNPSILKMHFSALIITSRPIATASLHRYISSRIEIAGFLQSEITRYFNEAIRGPKIVQKLSDRLRERPVIEASCYLPLNTAIITHVFLAQNHTLPTTLHGVFTSLVICCIIRHLKKQGKDLNISSLDNLPPDIQEPFNNLCTLAYHGVMENKATFSAADLQSFKLPTELSTLSLMQGVASFATFGESKLYNFLHLSTQELLAAFFIAKMHPEEQVKIFNELFPQPRFANVFQFYAGFTKLLTEGIRDAVSRIVKSNNKTLTLSLLHCLYEAQDYSLCQFIASQLKKELDLTNHSLSSVDCLSVGYFLGSVCSTITGEFKLKLMFDRNDEYGASLLVRELSKHSITGDTQPETAMKIGVLDLRLKLSGNRRTDTSPVMKLICSSTMICKLDLSENGIGDTETAALADVQKANHNLKALNLMFNEIGDEGAVALADALKVNWTLKTLNLGRNKIGDEGAIKLADALKVNWTLKTLNVERNMIGDKGATSLEIAQRGNQKLHITVGAQQPAAGESTGADESSHSNVEHYLSNEELLTLQYILQEDVIDSLQQIGLDLKTIGDSPTTIEEVQRALYSLDQHEVASSLRQQLDLALENKPHYEAYQQALKEQVAIPLKYLKVLFFGPPRTGKTSMRRRLVGEIQNLARKPVQASTGTAEAYDVIVKVVEDKTATSRAVIRNSEWSTVQALFGQERIPCAMDLDDELQLLYQFTYGFAPTIEEEFTPVRSNPEEKIEKDVHYEDTKGQSLVEMKTDNVPSSTELSKTTNLNTSVILEESSRHGLTAKEMEEIEKVFQAFDKILRAGGQKQLKVLLDKTILMNMVDTGGQPAFLEMVPALTTGPALNLIFFRLDQELKKRYQIQYVSKDGEKVLLGNSSYTVEEVIFQALSSITCFSYTAPTKVNMPNPSNAAVLVGTHKDLLGSNPELVATEIKAKDGTLQKNLQEILDADLVKSHKNFLYHASDDQLMFAIDNKNGDENELIEVRKRLEEIINQEFDDFPIPASWLMFSIFLRKMGQRTLSLLQCHEIGERLKVKDTSEVLWFLHHYVGIPMHFSDVEGIKDVVICDPQVVFDSVTDLILNSFRSTKVITFACHKFKETGQFKFSDIQRIAKSSKSDSLPLPKLVKLLEHLNVIAPIKPGCSSPESDALQEAYFMPAVLEHATEEELHMEQSPTDPVPLMIHFKCGFVPIGVFCAMIASLVAQADILGLILHNRGGHILRKNKVTFRIDGAYNVIMISKPKWYEIHITRVSTKHRALEEICKHVLETVCDTLDQVISKMKYKQNLISSRSDQTLYELGFKCPNHPDDNHLVINRPKSRVQAPSQSAKSLWFYYLQEKSVMICLKEEISVDLKDTSLSPSFAQQSLVWFGEAREIPQASIPVDPPDIIQHPKDQSVATGAGITFRIEASGDSLEFQWQKDRDDIGSNESWLCSNKPNTSTLQIPCVKKSDQGHYRCLVKNPVEQSGKSSYEAKLAVFDPPDITQHPKDQSVATGADIMFKIVASGDSLEFQWQKDGDDIGSNESWLCSSKPNTSTLQIPCVEKSDQGHYRCLVKNPVEQSGKSSYEAKLAVFDPPDITQHPKDQSVATGADITFKIVASGDSLEFQWQKDGDDIGTDESWLCSSKPNTNTLQIPCVKKSDQGHYRCLVKNPVECSEISSYEAELTVCLKLDEKNVVNVLHQARFADGDWENLGQQLIEHHALRTIRTNHPGQCGLCMSDTISQWLNNDLEASWEKLAETVVKVEGYGEATAHIVQQKAGICAAVTSEEKRVSSQSQPISTADTHSIRKQKPSEDVGVPKKAKFEEESETSNMAPTPKRNPAAAEQNPAEETQVELTLEDHFEVTEYLLDFKEADIHHLGLTLGLHYDRLKSMSGSETFLDDMIALWLKKEDQVLKRGVPTWETLVKALRHRRVNQTEVADRIETEKLK